jgi:hypothetical protein
VSLTRVTPNIIAVANNVVSKTVGSATSIPTITFDGAGVIVAASNTAIDLDPLPQIFMLSGM